MFKNKNSILKQNKILLKLFLKNYYNFWNDDVNFKQNCI